MINMVCGINKSIRKQYKDSRNKGPTETSKKKKQENLGKIVWINLFY